MRSPPPNLVFGVPRPFPFEAPSSWLSRLALAQGRTLKDLLIFLDIKIGGDLDFEMCEVLLPKLRLRCPSARGFAVAERVMEGLHRARLPSEYLLTDSYGGPRFRYCPACLKQRRVAHLDIHWRFLDWRYCPEHNCLMEDFCWKCKAAVSYPCDMELSNAGRAGYPSQRRCQICLADLAAVAPCPMNPSTSTIVTELEACWLLNGRALLASLYSGTARYRGWDIGFNELGHRAHSRSGWLPYLSEWVPVERRIREAQPSSGQEHAPLPPKLLTYETRTRWGTVLRIDRDIPGGSKPPFWRSRI